MNKAQWLEFLDLDLYDIDRKLSGLTPTDKDETFTEEQMNRRTELLKERLYTVRMIGLVLGYKTKKGFTELDDDEEIKLSNLIVEEKKGRN